MQSLFDSLFVKSSFAGDNNISFCRLRQTREIEPTQHAICSREIRDPQKRINGGNSEIQERPKLGQRQCDRFLAYSEFKKRFAWSAAADALQFVKVGLTVYVEKNSDIGYRQFDNPFEMLSEDRAASNISAERHDLRKN